MPNANTDTDIDTDTDKYKHKHEHKYTTQAGEGIKFDSVTSLKDCRYDYHQYTIDSVINSQSNNQDLKQITIPDSQTANLYTLFLIIIIIIILQCVS